MPRSAKSGQLLIKAGYLPLVGKSDFPTWADKVGFQVGGGLPDRDTALNTVEVTMAHLGSNRLSVATHRLSEEGEVLNLL